jgi:trimeric autotransporter adhesin
MQEVLVFMAFWSYLMSFGWLADKAWSIVSGLFKSIYESIMKPFEKFGTFKTLVFGKEDSKLVYNTFDPSEISNAIAPGVQYMSYIVGFFLMLGIIYMGVKISTGGLNPSNRTMFIEYIRDWILVIIVLYNLGFFYEMVFMFNSTIINILKGDLIKNLNDSVTPELGDAGLVGWIIVGLFYLGITLWANWYYLMRKITLMILMVLGPIFISLFVFPSTKKVTLAWAREFFGTVMIQSIHAITIWTIAILAKGQESNWLSGVADIEIVLMYLIVIPAGEAIRNLFNLGGDTAGNLGRFGTMAGFGALAGIYGSIKSAREGSNLVQALRDGVKSVKGADGVDGADSEGVGANTGPLTGTDTRAERMLRAGEIVSKAGKAVVGSAGAIAGAATGRNGALVGAMIGSQLGSTAGGLVGRIGAAAKEAGMEAFAKMKNGFEEGIEGFSNEQEAEKIAEALAVRQTDEWAKANKEAFMEEQKRLNPELINKPKELEKMWRNKLAEQKKAFKQQNKDMLLAGKMDPNYAKASDLAEQMALYKFNKSLEQNGRDQFVQSLPKDMSPEDVEKAWEQEKAKRLAGYRKEAYGLAKKVVGTKPLDSYINKDDFLAAYKVHEMGNFEEGKKKFVQEFKKKHPTATQAEIDAAWEQERNAYAVKVNESANRIAANTKSIPHIAIGKDSARVSDLVEQAAVDMTAQWASRNEVSFKQALRDKGVPEQEITTRWNSAVSEVLAKNTDFVANVAKKVTGGQSLGAIIDKQQFAEELTKQRVLQAKEKFAQDNPTLEGAELDKAFNDSGIARVIAAEVQSSVMSIPTLRVSKGFDNKEALAAQYASQMTDQWAKDPQNYENFKKAFAENPINQQLLQTEGSQAYNDKLQKAWENAVQAQYNGNFQQAQEIITQNSNTGVVLPHSFGGLVHGARGFVKGFADGAGISFEAREARAEAFEQLSPAEKMLDYRNKVAYRHGILKGVSGYQKAAKKAMIDNPYIGEFMENAYELSDIARMAKKETVQLPNGETITRVAKGAVQLVVERDRSYVQVLTQDNQVKTVSQYGAGDSTLKEGETLFKDYTIENGSLVPVRTEGNKHGFYMKDTAGAKIAYNRQINIDPNQLMITRRQIINQELEPLHDAYNYKVETGEFTLKDVQTHNADPNQKVVLVVERDRSYVAMKAEDNKMYRVSEVSNIGNPNLKLGETIYKEYVVEGGQLRERSINKNIQLETYMYNEKGERIRVDSSRIPSGLNVNELIPPASNKRVELRRQLEQKRIKSGAYL